MQHPYSGKTLPSAMLYPSNPVVNFDAWLRELRDREVAPTEHQLDFLKSLIHRVQVEAEAEQAGRQKHVQQEPLFEMIHGVPGSGKSQLIAWIREAFEKVLGWVHGVQFVCIAFQNAMAAHIDCFTVHHWAGLPVGDTDGFCTTRDNNKFCTRCQSLRFSSSTRSV